MNGPHDLGGQYGFGRINPEPEISELVFHHDWERKVFAITLACGFLGKWNIDEARHARERQHPAPRTLRAHLSVSLPKPDVAPCRYREREMLA